MPLQAIAIKDFNTPLMRESIHQDELKMRIAKLYEQDTRYHDYASGDAVVSYFEKRFVTKHSDHNADTSLYIGMFNDNPICAISCIIEASQANNNQNLAELASLAMHTANLNRGIEEQFIKLICQNKDITFYSNNKEIQQIIDKNH